MKLLILASALLISANASAIEAAPFRHSLECTLKAVTQRMGVEFSSQKPLPRLFVESKTPLKQLQDAIEPQWKMRPEAFINAYIVADNDIYLTDNLAYYTKVGRFVDDSLAHELAHYVQVVYKNYDLNDDSLEMQAVSVQTWYRETFMIPNVSPCP